MAVMRGVESFIAALAAGAIDGLLDRVGGQHSKGDGNAGLEFHGG